MDGLRKASTYRSASVARSTHTREPVILEYQDCWSENSSDVGDVQTLNPCLPCCPPSACCAKPRTVLIRRPGQQSPTRAGGLVYAAGGFLKSGGTRERPADTGVIRVAPECPPPPSPVVERSSSTQDRKNSNFAPGVELRKASCASDSGRRGSRKSSVSNSYPREYSGARDPRDVSGSNARQKNTVVKKKKEPPRADSSKVPKLLSTMPSREKHDKELGHLGKKESKASVSGGVSWQSVVRRVGDPGKDNERPMTSSGSNKFRARLVEGRTLSNTGSIGFQHTKRSTTQPDRTGSRQRLLSADSTEDLEEGGLEASLAAMRKNNAASLSRTEEQKNGFGSESHVQPTEVPSDNSDWLTNTLLPRESSVSFVQVPEYAAVNPVWGEWPGTSTPGTYGHHQQPIQEDDASIKEETGLGYNERIMHVGSRGSIVQPNVTEPPPSRQPSEVWLHSPSSSCPPSCDQGGVMMNYKPSGDEIPTTAHTVMIAPSPQPESSPSVMSMHTSRDVHTAAVPNDEVNEMSAGMVADQGGEECTDSFSFENIVQSEQPDGVMILNKVPKRILPSPPNPAFCINTEAPPLRPTIDVKVRLVGRGKRPRRVPRRQYMPEPAAVGADGRVHFRVLQVKRRGEDERGVVAYKWTNRAQPTEQDLVEPDSSCNACCQAEPTRAEEIVQPEPTITQQLSQQTEEKRELGEGEGVDEYYYLDESAPPPSSSCRAFGACLCECAGACCTAIGHTCTAVGTQLQQLARDEDMGPQSGYAAVSTVISYPSASATSSIQVNGVIVEGEVAAHRPSSCCCSAVQRPQIIYVSSPTEHIAEGTTQVTPLQAERYVESAELPLSSPGGVYLQHTAPSAVQQGESLSESPEKTASVVDVSTKSFVSTAPVMVVVPASPSSSCCGNACRCQQVHATAATLVPGGVVSVVDQAVPGAYVVRAHTPQNEPCVSPLLSSCMKCGGAGSYTQRSQILTIPVTSSVIHSSSQQLPEEESMQTQQQPEQLPEVSETQLTGEQQLSAAGKFSFTSWLSSKFAWPGAGSSSEQPPATIRSMSTEEQTPMPSTQISPVQQRSLEETVGAGSSPAGRGEPVRPGGELTEVFLPHFVTKADTTKGGRVPVFFRVMKRREVEEPKPKEPETVLEMAEYYEGREEEPVVRFRVLQSQLAKDNEDRRLLAFRPPVHLAPPGAPPIRLARDLSGQRGPCGPCSDVCRHVSAESADSVVTMKFEHRRTYSPLRTKGRTIRIVTHHGDKIDKSPESLEEDRKVAVSSFAARVAAQAAARVAKRRAQREAEEEARKEAERRRLEEEEEKRRQEEEEEKRRQEEEEEKQRQEEAEKEQQEREGESQEESRKEAGDESPSDEEEPASETEGWCARACAGGDLFVCGGPAYASEDGSRVGESLEKDKSEEDREQTEEEEKAPSTGREDESPQGDLQSEKDRDLSSPESLQSGQACTWCPPYFGRRVSSPCCARESDVSGQPPSPSASLIPTSSQASPRSRREELSSPESQTSRSCQCRCWPCECTSSVDELRGHSLSLSQATSMRESSFPPTSPVAPVTSSEERTSRMSQESIAQSFSSPTTSRSAHTTVEESWTCSPCCRRDAGSPSLAPQGTLEESASAVDTARSFPSRVSVATEAVPSVPPRRELWPAMHPAPPYVPSPHLATYETMRSSISARSSMRSRSASSTTKAACPSIASWCSAAPAPVPAPSPSPSPVLAPAPVFVPQSAAPVFVPPPAASVFVPPPAAPVFVPPPAAPLSPPLAHAPSTTASAGTTLLRATHETLPMFPPVVSFLPPVVEPLAVPEDRYFGISAVPLPVYSPSPSRVRVPVPAAGDSSGRGDASAEPPSPIRMPVPRAGRRVRIAVLPARDTSPQAASS
ncbi:hypothetical protein CSUI_005028 [Cystoisospora suis]|uniref:Uncharacterized protein n=1 Tax=Cystoisospora suis TaxID=483139 RepID=A0A2C6KKX1_9APIC|nr:hypothetical protein CSUI_005028 [Cystoisospora suis]